MKNSAKLTHSDRFIPARSCSAPKHCFSNTLAQFASDQIKDSPHTIAKQSSSTKSISLHQTMSTKQTTIREFLFHTIPKSQISNTAIPTISPSLIFDAQQIVDDYYYNCLDVARNGFVALGIENSVTMFRARDGCLVDLTKQRKQMNYVAGVKYSEKEQFLICGDEGGVVEVFDVEKVAAVRTFKAHTLRIGRIENHAVEPHLIFTGSKDYDVKLHDLRVKHTIVTTFSCEYSQVTGLTLTDSLMATGHNNGKVVIWDIRKQKQLITLANHTGAVKALSWCPWRQSTLVSGGGKKDKEIIIYNSSSQEIQSRIPSRNQISSICWRNSTQQIIYSESRSEATKRVGRIHMSNHFNRGAKRVRFEEMRGRILGMKIDPSNEDVLISLSANNALAYWELAKVETKVKASDVLENIGCQ